MHDVEEVSSPWVWFEWAVPYSLQYTGHSGIADMEESILK